MEYMELLKQMIAECRNDAERYLSGDKQDYLYCLEKDEKYGNTDSNYTNRTRLCYGLMYGEFEPESIEDAVRELFVSEVISRENESFQGIGVNIELLSAMLQKYASPDDDSLFKRAKNANFDCFCGYDKDLYADYFPALEDFTLDECIDAAGKMGKTDYACKFVDIFKAQPMGFEELKRLRSYAMYDTKRMSDRELAAAGLYEYYISQPQENEYALLTAVEEYVLMLADKGEADKAGEIFLKHSDIFSTHHRTAYEVGSRLIRDDISRKDDVWRFILPMITSEFDRIAPIGYAPLAESAEKMGDKTLAKILRKTGEKKLAAIRKESERFKR